MYWTLVAVCWVSISLELFQLDSTKIIGHRITQLKEAMDSILYQLNPGDIFSIVTFNALVHVWNIPLTKASYSTKEELSGNYEASIEEMLPGSFPATEINIENAKKVSTTEYHCNSIEAVLI